MFSELSHIKEIWSMFLYDCIFVNSESINVLRTTTEHSWNVVPSGQYKSASILKPTNGKYMCSVKKKKIKKTKNPLNEGSGTKEVERKRDKNIVYFLQ